MVGKILWKICIENEDGSVFAHIPISYVKISPPRKISEEKNRRQEKDSVRCGKKTELMGTEWITEQCHMT